jgi:Tfp pilus assembly protein PilO
MLTISRRERVVIGVALGGLALVALYLYAVEPLVNRTADLTELIPAREATLQARQRLIAQRARLTEEGVEAAKAFEEQQARLLSGPTAPLAASELQTVVKEVATAANVDVRSERVLPVADLEGLVEVPIELTVAGSVRDIVALLSQIERTRRLLTVKDLKVRVVAVGQPKELLATLTVAGYLLPQPAGGST